MIDAVLSYHANPQTCGVTKFNVQLAERLGVPHAILRDIASHFKHPLVSVKRAEFVSAIAIADILDDRFRQYDVLWHGPGVPTISGRASHVWFAHEVGCPSTLRGDPTRKGLTILTFGMLHKLQQPMFLKLRALLDASGHDYTVCVSSAIHEGSPWDEATAAHTATLRDIFGAHLRWLGFLADDALAREIREAHTIALFYDPAVRANNTTLWAALDAGTPVITNLDAASPPELQHGVSVFDIHQLTEWPEYDGKRQDIRAGGRKASAAYSWDRLLEKLQAVHA